MKTTHFLLALLCISSASIAQPYGEKAYPHANTRLSSGKRVTVNGDGFLLAGYRAVGTSTDDNFYIDRTDPGGLFSTSVSFQARYALRQPNTAGFTCAAGFMPVTNCVGVSAIEASNNDYMVVGAYDKGMFFVQLDNTGAVLSSRLFMFPVATSSVMKPLIAEAPNGNFFVCGSYNDGSKTIAYFFELSSSGGIINSAVKQYATSTIFEIRDMIASPFNMNYMAIVGVILDANNINSRKGFIAEWYFSGGAWMTNFYDGHGQALNAGVDELNAIAVDPGTGYVVGGYSDVTAGPDNDWFMKVSPAGSITWSNIFSPSNPDNIDGVQAIMAVVEPVNNSRYIYGASYSPTKGIVVMKQDGMSAGGGAWVGSGLTAFNEFEYTLTNLISSPIALSSSLGGSADEGIHVYGRGQGYATSAGNHYLVEAYLNGEEACSPNRSPNGSTSTFAQSTYTPATLGNGTALVPCNNFLVVANSVTSPLYNTICSSGTMATGSNLRPGLATGLEKAQRNNLLFAAAPNPTTGKLLVKFHSQQATNGYFRLVTQLGQEVRRIGVSGEVGDQQLQMDLGDLPAGIYSLHGTIDGMTHTLKVVHTAD